MNDLRKLKDLVTKENIKIHAQEAPIYERIHPQVFNWYHNRKSWRDVRHIFDLIGSKGKVEALDLGCGTGFLTMKAISFKDLNITAVDLSKEMLSELERKIPAPSKESILLVNSEALDFMRDNEVQYDLIMASAFLHHLVDLKEFTDLALKRLKSGGVLYIAYEPLKQDIGSKFQFMLHRWVRILDEAIFNFRMKLSKVEVDESHENSIADYQTTLGGIDPLEVMKYLENSGKVMIFNKFAVRANGVLAFISDRIIRSENTFSIIFKKS